MISVLTPAEMICVLKPADYPFLGIAGIDEMVEARRTIASRGGEPRIVDLDWDWVVPIRDLPWIPRRFRQMELIGLINEPAEHAGYWRELTGPRHWLPGFPWVFANGPFMEKVRAAVQPCTDNEIRRRLGVKPIPRPASAFQGSGRRLAGALDRERDLSQSARQPPVPSPGPLRHRFR
jgi:hypothetical protein